MQKMHSSNTVFLGCYVQNMHIISRTKEGVKMKDLTANNVLEAVVSG